MHHALSAYGTETHNTTEQMHCELAAITQDGDVYDEGGCAEESAQKC